MDQTATTPFAGEDALQELARQPRNIWTRFRVALQLIAEARFYEARAVLEGLRHNPAATEDVFAIYWGQLLQAEARAGAVRRLNRPADYLGSQDAHLLLPFRRLEAGAKPPKPYPWGMALPGFAGPGNNARFLQEAAAALAGSFVPAIRRICVLVSPAEGVTLQDLAADLQAQQGSARIDAAVFGQEGEAAVLPGGGRLEFLAPPLFSAAGQAETARRAADSDLVLFLSGDVRLDPMALARALPLAEVSDRVVQFLAPMPAGKQAEGQGFATLYSEVPHRARIGARYPFREMAGLNLAISPRLLAETGPLDPRFSHGGMAARELAYRAWVRGAWFVPLSVPHLDAGAAAAPAADSELYKALCPNHWDRKREAWHEVPKVSVYIPAWNASKYIQRAVDSVLSQDYPDLDVCIANDGSQDGTLALLDRLYSGEKRVRWIDNPNGGIGFASNSAIRMSNSIYIGQLDSDDCLKPGAVRRLATFLDENAAVACAYASCERIDAGGNYTQDEYSWPVFSREKMMITSIAHHFRMFRRQAWERTSRFREDIVNGVDYDIFLKMSEVGEFRHIDERLYQRRWHGENTSHVNEHHQTANTHRVQREALARQGLSRFWDVHVPDPEKPKNVTYKLREGVKMVVFWPDYSRANPYQRLLYGKLRQRDEVVAGDIDAALRLLDSETVAPADLTFHLHWLNFLFVKAKDAAEAQAAVDAFLAKIEKFIWKGGRLLWTVHNTISHDTPYPEIEQALSARLAELAHGLHFHAASSVPEVTPVFPVPAEKVLVSRHGHYIGAYPDFVDRAAARAALGIGADEDVILFTGQIRGYKGVETLVAAFRAILADRPRARLVLAGKSEGDPLAGLGLTEAERGRILTTGRFVEDGELQLFFRAADVAAYPYQKILTSGSLLLALSYGVPAVIPRVGQTAEVLEGREAGRLYDGETGAAGLTAVLREMLAAKDAGRLEVMAANARTLAEELDWPDFGAVL